MQETTHENFSEYSHDKSNSCIGKGEKMGTRKHPIAFGKTTPNRIRNQSEMSYEGA
jgi:hypothetical protein